MSHYAITSVRVFDGYKFIYDSAVVVKDGLVEAVVKMADLSKSIEHRDYKGCTVSAGFVDLQLNGCGGVLFNDRISEKTLDIMHKTEMRFGCTSYVPTLVTTTPDEVRKAVDVAIAYNKAKPLAILGIHLEGPYISKAKRGAHNPVFIKPIDDEMVSFLCEKNKEIQIFITLAPEENDKAHIRKLAEAGVIVSIGHTNATYEQAIEGIANGISIATHLFNAMSPLEGRAPGVVGAVLNSPIYTGLIVDGMHSSFNSVNLVTKIKQDKIYIVTDAVTSMGTDMTEFDFAGQRVHVKDGKCINEEGALSGSNIDMASSLRNAIMFAGISADDAIKMATLYPAKAAGRELEIGAIRAGLAANLAVFDGDYKVTQTVFGGDFIL